MTSLSQSSKNLIFLYPASCTDQSLSSPSLAVSKPSGQNHQKKKQSEGVRFC